MSTEKNQLSGNDVGGRARVRTDEREGANAARRLNGNEVMQS